MRVLGIAGLLFAIILLAGIGVLALQPVRRPDAAVRYHEFSGRAFGTTYRLKWCDDSSEDVVRLLREEVEDDFQQLDRQLSIYRSDSELAAFNASPSLEPRRFSSHIVAYFRDAMELRRMSNGAFDPTILPLLKAWGFGPYPRRSTLPTPTEIFSAQQCLGRVKAVRNCLQKTHPEAAVDLSAVGEGWALVWMQDRMRMHGFKNYCLEFGGEVFAEGRSIKGRPWRVGIERPEPGASALWCVVELDGVGVSTSGSYRNFVEIDGQQYSHILDPRTGRPVEHSGVSVSVIHAESVLADGWSTALMVLGPDAGFELAKQKNLAALFIYRENRVLKSRETPEFTSYVRETPGANANRP